MRKIRRRHTVCSFKLILLKWQFGLASQFYTVMVIYNGINTEKKWQPKEKNRNNPCPLKVTKHCRRPRRAFPDLWPLNMNFDLVNQTHPSSSPLSVIYMVINQKREKYQKQNHQNQHPIMDLLDHPEMSYTPLTVSLLSPEPWLIIMSVWVSMYTHSALKTIHYAVLGMLKSLFNNKKLLSHTWRL